MRELNRRSVRFIYRVALEKDIAPNECLVISNISRATANQIHRSVQHHLTQKKRHNRDIFISGSEITKEGAVRVCFAGCRLDLPRRIIQGSSTRGRTPGSGPGKAGSTPAP